MGSWFQGFGALTLGAMKRILGQVPPSHWPISQLSRIGPGTSRKPGKPATTQLPPSFPSILGVSLTRMTHTAFAVVSVLLISTGCCCSCSGAVANLVVFSTRMKPSCTLIVLSLEFHAVPPPHNHLILRQNRPCSAADWG